MEANTIPTLAGSNVVTTAFSAFRNEGDEQFSFVRPYDPKAQSIKEMRHAVIRYRNTEGKNTVQKAAQMLTVPTINFRDDLALVMDEKEIKVFRAVIEDAEDMVIRSLLDAGASKVNWSQIGYATALDFLTAERVSKRLTKEEIENWFNIAGKPWCDARAEEICTGKNITDEATKAKQYAGTFNAYKDRMCRLAAPVPNLQQTEAQAIKNMLVSAKLADDMAKVLLNKIDAILNPKVLESGDL